MSIETDTYDAEDAMRHLRARLQAMLESQLMEVRRREILEAKAEVLLQAGCVLIPSPHLKDNEFVVSQELYEAAKRKILE